MDRFPFGARVRLINSAMGLIVDRGRCRHTVLVAWQNPKTKKTVEVELPIDMLTLVSLPLPRMPRV